MSKICIFHANCADGFGAAWAVWKALGDHGTTYRSASYGDPIPDLHGFDEVIMVDFSYKRPELLEIANKVNRVHIIDHHESAERELVDLPDNVECEFDVDRSGAVMAWEAFHPGQPVPAILRFVQDRDLWRWEFEDTRPYTEAMFSYRPWSFEQWSQWAHEGAQSLIQQQLIAEGNALMRQKRTLVEGAVTANNITWVQLCGSTVPCASAIPAITSDTGHRLLELYPDAPFAAVARIIGKEARMSLRSDVQNGLHNVARVAEKHGGGGHANAAGFTMPTKQYLNCIVSDDVV